MEQVDQQGRTVDRIAALSGIPKTSIQISGLDHLIDDEYFSEEAIYLSQHEVDSVKEISNRLYRMFREAMDDFINRRQFEAYKLPSQMLELIEHSWANKHMHLLGRFDFAGGIDGIPLKMLELNADTPTMLPESTIIQAAYAEHEFSGNTQQYNQVLNHLDVAFNRLTIAESKRHLSLLGTSFGFQDDVVNAKLILESARKEGFDVLYSDLPDIEFSKNEGIFVEVEKGEFQQYDFLYKMFPWEYISYEEPELLNDLHNLITQDLLYVLNPAYTLIMQSKQFMVKLSEMFNDDNLLKTTMTSNQQSSGDYVKKVVFGRLGENISIYNNYGEVASTKGDFGHYPSIYQEFAQLYKDNSGDYYQMSDFVVGGFSSGLGFRRAEKMIIDDDAEFVPHFINPRI